MCKLYLQPVDVQIGPGGEPFSIGWRGKWYLVTTSYFYDIRPKDFQWYKGMGLDPYQQRLRCVTDLGMDCDLIKEKGEWFLERVWD